jgi:hypothetical protein
MSYRAPSPVLMAGIPASLGAARPRLDTLRPASNRSSTGPTSFRDRIGAAQPAEPCLSRFIEADNAGMGYVVLTTRYGASPKTTFSPS